MRTLLGIALAGLLLLALPGNTAAAAAVAPEPAAAMPSEVPVARLVVLDDTRTDGCTCPTRTLMFLWEPEGYARLRARMQHEVDDALSRVTDTAEALPQDTDGALGVLAWRAAEVQRDAQRGTDVAVGAAAHVADRVDHSTSLAAGAVAEAMPHVVMCMAWPDCLPGGPLLAWLLQAHDGALLDADGATDRGLLDEVAAHSAAASRKVDGVEDGVVSFAQPLAGFVNAGVVFAWQSAAGGQDLVPELAACLAWPECLAGYFVVRIVLHLPSDPAGTSADSQAWAQAASADAMTRLYRALDHAGSRYVAGSILAKGVAWHVLASGDAILVALGLPGLGDATWLAGETVSEGADAKGRGEEALLAAVADR